MDVRHTTQIRLLEGGNLMEVVEAGVGIFLFKRILPSMTYPI